MVVHYNLAAALIGNLCGILILFSILLNSNVVRERKNDSYSRWMTYMILVCLLGCISEIIFELVDGRVFLLSRLINLLAKTTNHAESIYAGFLFIGAMRALMFEEEKHWPRALKTVAIITCVFGAIMLVVNLFTGIAFTINEDNIYARGPLGQLGLMISMATLLYTIIILTIGNKNSKTYLRFPVLIYALPFIVGGGLQMVNSSLRLSNVAFSLGIATAFLSVQKRLLYTDAMTGVYNRAYLDYLFNKIMKRRKNRTFGGILMDINSFKEINDTHGHGVGDEALINAAEILKDTSGSDYIIIRYGGDEFILVRENADMDELLHQKEIINTAVKEFNKNNSCLYELSFSIGTSEYASSSGDFDTFLENMDKSLYLDKKAYYESTGKERRR